MHIKRKTVPIIFSLMLIMIGIGISGCTPAAAVQPQNELDTHINTAVAATLVQYIIETKVAAEASLNTGEPVAQAQPTQTPLPTSTPIPTEEPPAASETPVSIGLPTATPLPNVLSTIAILADQNTNCRFGPSQAYSIIGTFLKGATSIVHGRDGGRNWWYIEHPSQAGQYCWVWDGSTTIQGDSSGIPVQSAPESAGINTSNTYYYDEEGSWYQYQPYTSSFPQNICGINTCGNYGYPIIWTDGNKCSPIKCICYPIPVSVKWDPCYPYTDKCNCGYTWSNPCKKSNCPAVTIVNMENYCKKYPKCCK